LRIGRQEQSHAEVWPHANCYPNDRRSAGLLRAARGTPLGRTVIPSPVVVVLSNLVSNVPAVLIFRPLVPHFPDPHRAWLALAMSSTLAGNLTVPGSVASLIVVFR
jgi:Na+/H+ antiporter NhaD/arsenite permease-like protein